MADQQKLIVIFGINSRQGSAVARYLVGKSNLRICGITRDASCDASQAWAELGVSMLQIKEPHKETLAVELAVKGASAIFVVTDYFYHYLDDHSTANLAGVTKTDAHGHAANRELQDGIAIVDAVEKEIKEVTDIIAEKYPMPDPAKNTLKFSFVLSCMTFDTLDLVKLWQMIPSGLQQFRVKAHMADYIHAKCPYLASQTRLLNPALRMEDWTDFLRWNRDDTYTFGTTLPANFDLPWTHFTDDIGPLFYMCCQQLPGLNLAAISDIKSGAQICDIISKATGKPCEYIQYSEQALVQLLGSTRGPLMVDMLTHLAGKKYYEGQDMTLSHHIMQTEPAGKYKLTSLEEYVAVGLPDWLKAKGWVDALFGEEGLEWPEERSSPLPLQRDEVGRTFDECVKEARVRNAQEEESSNVVAAVAFPQRPVMEPFTPPRA